LLFPNTKPEPGPTQKAQYNQKHDALTNYCVKDDGQLYRLPTDKEKQRGKADDRRVICNTEIFDRIREVHLQLKHAGVNKVSKVIGERFYGIRKEEVEWLLKHCQTWWSSG
jgi:hypothetical protein